MESRIAFKRAAFRRAAVGWLERDAEHGGCVWGALTTSALKSLFGLRRSIYRVPVTAHGFIANDSIAEAPLVLTNTNRRLNQQSEMIQMLSSRFLSWERA